MKTKKRKRAKEDFATLVGRGLRRSARRARKIAKMYGTPLYSWKDGKVVAEKP